MNDATSERLDRRPFVVVGGGGRQQISTSDSCCIVAWAIGSRIGDRTSVPSSTLDAPAASRGRSSDESSTADWRARLRSGSLQCLIKRESGSRSWPTVALQTARGWRISRICSEFC